MNDQTDQAALKSVFMPSFLCCNIKTEYFFHLNEVKFSILADSLLDLGFDYFALRLTAKVKDRMGVKSE